MSARYLEEIHKDALLFAGCRELSEIRRLMNVDLNELMLHSLHPRYYSFAIRKQSGGYRVIETPVSSLKEIQHRLNYFLQAWYFEHQTDSSYGYIICPKKQKPLKNIVSNASLHLGKPYMMQIDFDDFFHQIKSTDIYNVFKSGYFSFSEKAACTLAKTCTYNGRLPMGAPTSPVLSNIFVIGLDRKIENWAAGNSVCYSRFVDDLTFSSTERSFSQEDIQEITEISRQFHLGLNPQKTRFSGPGDIKTVTGLELNKTVDIPEVFYQTLENDLSRLKNVFEATILTGNFDENPLLRKYKHQVQGELNFIGMVEGFESSQFREYAGKYHRALEADEELYSMRWTHFSYL